MIVCFVIDTSASCNQRASNGLSVLDMSKSGVEHFLKVRARDWASRGDRYLLVTCADGVAAIRAEWRDSYAEFQHALKNVHASDATNLGGSLRQAFDLLTQFRLQSGIDSYAQGRRPSNSEPAMIVVLTDGGELTSLQKGVVDLLTLPHAPRAGSELTLEPFRWDMRVYSVVIRVPGIDAVPMATPPADAFAIHSMCEVTGGRVSVVTSMKELLSAVDMLASRVASQRGVVVVLDSADTPTLPMPMRVFLALPNAPSLWPIPEAFFPSSSMTTFPARTASPTLTFVKSDGSPSIPAGFPVDRYELVDASLLSAYLSEHCSPGSCWYVHVVGSGTKPTPRSASADHPCGYLRLMKASGGSSTGSEAAARPALAVACLFILPYNFPVLFRLLDELVTSLNRTPTPKWASEFETYLLGVPPYYISALRTALKTMNLSPSLIPDRSDTGLNFAMAKHLKQLSYQSKVESDRLTASVNQNRAEADPALQQQESLDKPPSDQHDPGDYFSRGMADTSARAGQAVGNAYDIARSQLLSHLDVLRDVVWDRLQARGGVSQDDRHSVRISEMGNYQETMKARETLRLIDPEEDRKQHRFDFGNPFRRDKTAETIPDADELQEGMPAGNAAQVPGSPVRSPARNRGLKRKAAAGLHLATVPDAKRNRNQDLGNGSESDADCNGGSVAEMRQLRGSVMQVLRQPGFRADAVYQLLERVAASHRPGFLRFVITESRRMKHHALAEELETMP